MNQVSVDSVYRLSPTHRLQWEAAQNSDVLLYPEGMVTLNQSASEILKHCDGSRSVQEVVEELERKFSARDLTQDVISFLEAALERGWIKRAENASGK